MSLPSSTARSHEIIGAREVVHLHPLILPAGTVRLRLADVGDGLDWGLSLHGDLLTVQGKADALVASWLQGAGQPEEIIFDVAASGEARLEVFDVRGARLRTLASGSLAAGRHEIEWFGEDDSSRRLPPGVYLLRFNAGGQSWQRKVVKVDQDDRRPGRPQTGARHRGWRVPGRIMGGQRQTSVSGDPAGSFAGRRR